MQIANIFVALDKGNLVPKYGVTAAEIAVLRAIHGPESVSEIEPAGEVSRSNSEELGRLRDSYSAAHDEDNQPILRSVYPMASGLHQTLDDLELPPELYKATTRAKGDDAPTPKAQEQAKVGSQAHSAVDDEMLTVPGDKPLEKAPHSDAFS